MCATSTIYNHLFRIIHDVIKRNIIGRQLKQARLSSRPKITQNELAARLQTLGIAIDRTMLSKIESGFRPVYDFELEALARALRIPLTQLFETKTEGIKARQR